MSFKSIHDFQSLLLFFLLCCLYHSSHDPSHFIEMLLWLSKLAWFYQAVAHSWHINDWIKVLSFDQLFLFFDLTALLHLHGRMESPCIFSLQCWSLGLSKFSLPYLVCLSMQAYILFILNTLYSFLLCII